MNRELAAYVEAEILPRYDNFDAAHRRDHALAVIERSLALAAHYDVDADMVYAVAAFHDTGLCEGRERHHLGSGRIIREDPFLHSLFSAENIETMAEAAEDHRASNSEPPRSTYGRIVAEADRIIDKDTIIRRTIQYGLSHCPGLDKEGHYNRFLRHMSEKYAEGGYLRLWIPESPNAGSLAEFRNLLRDPLRTRAEFDRIWAELGAGEERAQDKIL